MSDDTQDNMNSKYIEENARVKVECRQCQSVRHYPKKPIVQADRTFKNIFQGKSAKEVNQILQEANQEMDQNIDIGKKPGARNLPRQ